MGQKLSCISRSSREADILKLDIDCFEELFEYLSLADLVNVGKTCKRLQQAAGYCFQRNYRMFGINQIFGNNIVKVWGESIEIDCFAAFIENIVIHQENLQHFLNIQSKFHRLKEIELIRMENTDMDMIIDRMKPTLSKLKAFHIESCNLDKFHDVISLCPNITHLNISNCSKALDWINGKYPTLEYLKISAPMDDNPVDKLPMFLEQNPNIRKLAIDINSIRVIRDALKNAENIKLEELAILIKCPDFEEPPLVWCGFFNEFYALGFFKRLHLYINGKEITLNQQLSNRLGTVNGLVKLKCQYLSDEEKPSELIDLEELGGNGIYHVSDLKMMAIELVNLKHINLVEARIDDLLPFIRHSVKMQKIQVEFLTCGTHFSKDTGVIDLMALNREREQLPGAQKITLYVKEKIFLATKWSLGETDFQLIRLKREGTFDFNDYFGIFIIKKDPLVLRTRVRRIFGITIKREILWNN